MIRRPPTSTRTYTLFPYTTLFRSADLDRLIGRAGVDRVLDQMRDDLFHPLRIAHDRTVLPDVEQHRMRLALVPRQRRSEERRVGKECVSTRSTRWSPSP